MDGWEVTVTALAVVTCCVCVVPARAEATGKNGGPRVIVAFGDSTTATRGRLRIYADWLREAFPNDEIVNAGVGGNTTVAGLARMEKDVLARDPDLVIVQFGINDAAVDVWRKPPATASRVSRKRYEKNLREMVDRLRRGEAEVILMTPNPCCWTPKLKEAYGHPPYDPDDPNGFNAFLSEYAEAARRVARDKKVRLVDVYAAYQAHAAGDGCSLADLLLDGMHPNARGHELAGRLLVKEIGAMAGR
jgi:lysophospholipase L1-like esterase